MKSIKSPAKHQSELFSYTKFGDQYLADNNIRLIIVISDLHLAEGYSEDSCRWHRRENFTVDSSFYQFLAKKSEQGQAQKYRAWLIINGDFIDFLRITATPDDAGLLEWEQTLRNITSTSHSKTVRDMGPQILAAFEKFEYNWRKYVLQGNKWRRLCQKKIRDELKYGLKTQDFKSVYRLMMVNKGHRQAFQALANWLNDGHFITIVSGNHDQEFDQDLTQAGFTWMMERMIKNEATPSDPDFSGLLGYERQGLEIANKIRIEHGNRFEWHTRTRIEWYEKERQELFLAPGSLFNRYLLNRAELGVPFLDNVRPVTRVISFLLKRHKAIFLRILGKLMVTIYRLAHKKGARRLIWLGLLKVCYVLIPLLYLIIAGSFIIRNWDSFHPTGQSWLGIVHTNLWLFVSLPIITILIIVVYRCANRLTPRFRTDEVIEKMSAGFQSSDYPAKRYIICGHKHLPDIQNSAPNHITYLNSGTWSPVFEYDSGIVRDDLTMTFVELTSSGDRWDAKIRRWLSFHEKETEIILKEQTTKKLRIKR